MFFLKPKTYPIVDKFFDLEPKIKSQEGNAYEIIAGEFFLSIIVHNTGAIGVSWQTTFTRNGGNVPLTKEELKYFAKRVNEFIRNQK